LWQVSQLADASGADQLVGRVVGALAIGRLVGAGVAGGALRRDGDLGVVELGRLPGLRGLWQAKQLVLPTGTWVLFLPVTPPVPLWQDTQLVAALKVAWSTLPVDQVVVDLWQLSQLRLAGVNGVAGLDAGVAGVALRADRGHVGVHLGARPHRVARLVAGVAVAEDVAATNW
jgi:hypothetical protein